MGLMKVLRRAAGFNQSLSFLKKWYSRINWITS